MDRFTKVLQRGLILAVAAIFLLGSNSAFAVPAKPGLKKTITQSDGSKIVVEIRGDEHFSWRTTEAGAPIMRGEDGLYYYAEYTAQGAARLTASRVAINGKMQAAPAKVLNQNMQSIASAARSASKTMRSQRANAQTRSLTGFGNFPHEGKIRSAIILVEYSDVKFTIDDPYTAFYNQLNEEGYSVEGATGSARDYYTANSGGKFDGQFDVYGPYTLDHKRSYYGGNGWSGDDARPDQMIWDAVKKASADGADFSVYDYDDNGYIDNVFVYYAGHNEAEGGDEDCVWPHKWVVNDCPKFDGKYLYDYACTSELRGSYGKKIAGIGTFCHEFGHVFGLYDHYDTDYDYSGYSQGLGEFDIMTSGSYNNDGNTPPLFNALEMEMIGWCESEVLDNAKNINIKPIQNHQTYKILTEEEGEFFLIENRNKESIVWDNYIPAGGLIISHVDMSKDVEYLWEMNGPNTRPSHECFKFVVAGNVTMNGYNWSRVPYPYSQNNEWSTLSSPKAKSWAGKEIDINIVDIARDGENITFKSVVRGEYNMNVIVDRTDGFTDAFVGDVVPLEATIYPEVENDSVTWKSSNESVASVDSNGVVELLKVGKVTITATYLANTDFDGSIDFEVKELQGARGKVSSDGDGVQAKINFYPTTRSYEGGQAVFTRSSSAAITATTSSDGAYRVELAEGFYEAEVDAELYAENIEIVEISKGENAVNFSLESYSDRVDTITVEPYQIDATVEWNPQGYKYFTLELEGESDYGDEIKLTDCIVELTGLKANSDYNVRVRASSDGKEYTDLYDTKFTTLAKLTSMPMIRLSRYDYALGEVLELRTLNTTESDTTVWFIDGETQSRNKVLLDEGEHMIKAEVTRGNTIYTAVKFVNIK